MTCKNNKTLSLSEFCKLNLETLDSTYIFREVKIGETIALLLGVQSFEEMQDGHAVAKTGVYLMYESEPDVDDYENECYTNRQFLLSSINRSPETEVTRVEEIKLNNTVIPHSEMNNGCVEWLEFRTNKLLLEAIRQNKVPDRWLDLESARIWIAEYVIDDGYSIDKDMAENGEWAFSIEAEEQVYLICKTLTLPIGNDYNQTFTVEVDGEEVSVTVRGLEVIDGFDGEIRAVQYKTRDDLQLDFYSSRYLDECSCSCAVGIGLIAGTDDSGYRYSYIDNNGIDQSKTIEIELFSAHKVQ